MRFSILTVILIVSVLLLSSHQHFTDVDKFYLLAIASTVFVLGIYGIIIYVIGKIVLGILRWANKQ
jgi:hypothetical protein